MSGELRKYAYEAKGAATPPQYERVTRSLTDGELQAELAGKRARADAGWRRALKAEHRRRRTIR